MAKIPTVYFVSWYLHNKNNDGWAYKVEGKYNTLEAAQKAFYTALSTYVGGDPYDLVLAMLIDSDNYIHEQKRIPEYTLDGPGTDE